MNNKHLFDEKQRFSLRKLTVGLASVLVGLTLFGTAQTVNSQTVHAATTTQNDDDDDVIGEEPALDPSTGDPKHETIDVGFEANDQDQTIHYQTPDKDGHLQPATDKDGNPVPDGHVTGKTDDMNKDVPMPNGYVPQTPGTDDKTNLTNPNPDTGKVPDKTVTVEHGQHTTAPGETHHVGDQITPNPDDQKDAKVPGNTYQQAITDKDVKKDLTRTVTINKPKADGNTVIGEDGHQHIDLDTQTKSSTVSYHRTATVDDVTGKVTGYGNWQLVDPEKNKFAGVDIPVVDGYTAHITDGEGHTLSSIAPENAPTTDDAIEHYQSPKIVINYTANNQSRKYVFKDGVKIVDQKEVSGVTDQTVDPSTQLDDVMNDLKSKGYDVSNINLGGKYKFKASDNGENVIDLSQAHGFKEVKPGEIPAGITDPNKSGSDKHVTDSDVTETVTRHITFHDPTHENSTSTQDRKADQTVTLKRSFTYDDVTKQVTSWGEWSTADVPAVEVPKVAGYTATVTGAALTQDGKIAGDTLTDGYKDPKIEVTYTAEDSTQTIHYVDENGHELSATDNKDQNGDVIKNSTVTVKTDEVGNVQVPKGWKLVDDHDKTTKVAYGSDGKIPVKNVAITHATIEVTPDKPHKQGEPIDPKVPTGSKYGTGLTSDDLNDVAYREIHFKLPASTNAEDYAKRLKANGLSSVKVEGTDSVVVRQEVAYKRTAIVDAITGEVKGYTPAGVMNKGWVPNAENLVDAVIKNGSAVFNKVLIPQIAGYKAHTGNANVTIMKLANGSHAALSQLFVSFMAIPAPKDGNSTGAVNKEQVKPDDTKPGDAKSDTTPVKDLTKDDQKKIADDIKPAANPDAGKDNQDHKKGNQDHKTGETKPQANPDAGKGNKTAEPKPQANPDAGKGNQDHKKGNKTVEPKPQANPDAGKGTKPGKKAHVSPIVGHDSGANKKNSKITNTAASASDKSNRNTPVGSANDEANETNRTVQAAVVNSDKKVLPQTGASQNKIGIIGMVFASLAGMLGLAGTKKKRKND